MPPVVIALLAFNALVFLVYGFDKWRARRGGRRVPEAWLLLLAFAGGAAGAWLGVLLWRHKTRKPMFLFVLWLATAVNAGAAWLYLTGWPFD